MYIRPFCSLQAAIGVWNLDIPDALSQESQLDLLWKVGWPLHGDMDILVNFFKDIYAPQLRSKDGVLRRAFELYQEAGIREKEKNLQKFYNSIVSPLM
jgi:hypothetical protein